MHGVWMLLYMDKMAMFERLVRAHSKRCTKRGHTASVRCSKAIPFTHDGSINGG